MKRKSKSGNGNGNRPTLSQSNKKSSRYSCFKGTGTRDLIWLKVVPIIG